MTKRVQILGHIAEIANRFLGLDREVTVDTDNREIRLHDGTTEGGVKFLNRDANDERYQGRSVELDGLLGWEPNERGFTVRLGPSDYRLRSITVNGEELVVGNSDGYAGNPLLGLAPEVTTDRIWSGANVFTLPIEADGGLVGNVLGDTAGTHTGPVAGPVTGNLTGNAAGSHTGTFTGNVDTEGHGLNMADGQILLAWLEAAVTNFITNSGVPVGTVVAFAGAIGDIPANWFICDGLNGTPDLRARFIIGVSVDFVANATGGTLVHSHANAVESSGAHDHAVTVDDHTLLAAEIPSHSHFMAANVIDSAVLSNVNQFARETAAGGDTEYRAKGTATAATIGLTSTVGSGDPHGHSASIALGGAHIHTLDNADAATLPPYYALLYIMKGA